MINAKVLVIDDDPQLRMLLVYEIKKAGFETTEAGTVKEALDVLAREKTDVVLTDVNLPDGNGVELTRVIKAAYPAIEVIAITALGRISDGVKAIKNGAFDYLVKGDDNEKLVALIAQAAEKAGLQVRIDQLEESVGEIATGEDIISRSADDIEKATLIIKAINSHLRQRIMQFIFSNGKATVTEIYTHLNLEQAIASQHLAILKNAGLVKSERDGQKVYYSANYNGIEKVIVFVQQLLKSPS